MYSCTNFDILSCKPFPKLKNHFFVHYLVLIFRKLGLGVVVEVKGIRKRLSRALTIFGSNTECGKHELVTGVVYLFDSGTQRHQPYLNPVQSTMVFVSSLRNSLCNRKCCTSVHCCLYSHTAST